MKNYTKKPVTIQAVQWDGTLQHARQISAKYNIPCEINIIQGFLIKTLEGNLKASAKDYIIKGVKGEFYPCKEDIFWLTYDEADNLK